MESEFYLKIKKIINEDVSIILKEKFEILEELINYKQNVCAYCSKLESDRLKLFIVNGQNLYIFSILEEDKIEIYNKDKIEKMELDISNNIIKFSLNINNDEYTMDSSEMKLLFTSADLKKWLIQFVKELSKDNRNLINNN